MNFTEGQKQALEIMESGSNVFITGEAGTGKSYVVEEYIDRARDDGKEVLITAPTGTAADNIGGITIHRAFGAPIGVIPNNKEIKDRDEILQYVDIIVIDEISMCRFDLFEFISRKIQFENDERNRERFLAEMSGTSAKDDIQLIVMGDFWQLPPVMTRDDQATLEQFYQNKDFGKGYAFKSVYWDIFQFDMIKLTEIVRQEEAAFKTVLNRIQIGKDKNMCIDFLQRNSSDFPFTDDDAIFLSSTNKDVNEINSRQLAKIEKPIYEFAAECKGDIKSSEKFAEDTIYLKEGCKVMFTINDPEHRFVNGTIGIVREIKSKSFLQEIVVSVPGKNDIYLTKAMKEVVRPTVVEKEKSVKEVNENGDIVKVKKTVKSLDAETIGSFTQFPLRLAYAITIHKSQGKTFEKVNMNPYCWGEGQFYTGLSRCKKVGNICFTQNIKPKYIVASQEVMQQFPEV